MAPEHSGADALMSAITGEPLPDEARADAAFRAEHRRAEADVVLLREQLGMIGDALAGEPSPRTAPAPVRESYGRRRRPRWALATLVAAAVAAVTGGMGWLIAQGGGAGSASGSSADSAAAKEESGVLFGSPRYLACASLVVEGTVTAVERVERTGVLRITMDVTRSYKPEGPGGRELVIRAEEDTVSDVAAGARVLLGVPRGSATPDHWVVGERDVARERALIIASLGPSRGLDCP
ncbi:hypothetical protein AB0A94_06970 [Streptomyces sp. NPDC044984]|uniref:hypothetical protein n=1 Tax=Streptomyces sp. NPDC044984 TaxID=3154335 RepID=UPI003405CEA8